MSGNKTKTISELAFALTQHCDDLQIYANGISEDAVAEFAATEAAIMELIYELSLRFEQKGVPLNYETHKYLEAVKAKIAEIRAVPAAKMREQLNDNLLDVTKNESKFLYAFFGVLAAGKLIAGINYGSYKKIAKYGIYNGSTQKQLVEKITSGDINRIYAAAVRAFQDRETLAGVRASVRAELMKTRRYAKTETDSIVNGAANDVALAFAAANASCLMYVATLDVGVCEECASHDGEIYAYDDPEIPSIPRHANCRCRLLPTLPDNESPESGNSGVLLPFSDYFAAMTKTEQRNRLGEAKYNLWQSGAYKLKPYESPRSGQRMTITELKARDQNLFS